MNNESFSNESIYADNDTHIHLVSLRYENETVSEEDVFYPIDVVIPITAVYIVIFVTGLIGNISTCIVIARNKSMHTATNYYLFSLAISDLLLLVSGLPPETYRLWSPDKYIFGGAFCVIQGYAAETSTNATVLTITAFTIERYLAICHPFLSYTMSKLSRVVKYIVLIWVLSLCLAAPQAFQFGVEYKITPSGEEISSCMVVEPDSYKHAFEISTFLIFIGPMTLITVLYILIAIKLHKSKLLAGNGGLQRNSAKNEPASCRTRGTVGQRRVIKMLVAVVVAFFICWAPFHAQRLLAVYLASASAAARQSLTDLYIFINYLSGVLYFLSTTINPILYHTMSRKFREAFKVTFGQVCKKRPRLRRIDTGLYLSLTKYQQSFRSSRPTDCTEIQDLRGNRHPGDDKNVSHSNGTSPREYHYASKETNMLQTPLTHTEKTNGETKYGSLVKAAQNDLQRYKRHRHGMNYYKGDSNADRFKYRLFHIFNNRRSHFNRQISIESTTSATNTISNSSLQDVDDSEYTSSDLVRYMEQINNDIA